MSSADAPPCPGCGSSLSRVADHGVSHRCPSCGGEVLGLSPFERLVEDGLGRRAWVSSATGTGDCPCPWCGGAMLSPARDDGLPEGIAFCHVCEQVWVSAEAQAWLARQRANGDGTEPAAPARPAPVPACCGNCGGPFQPDQDGRCRFCRSQLVEPQPAFAAEPALPVGTANRVLDGLLSFLDTSVS